MSPAGTTVAKPGWRCDGGRGGDCCVVAGVAGRRCALRKDAERRSPEGPVRQGTPRAGTGAGADAARRARAARRRARGVGRRTVRLRRRRRSSGRTTSSTTPAIPRCTTCAARRCTSSGATRRRGASTTSRSSRSARRRPHGWRSCGWRASTRGAATSCSPTGSMSRCCRRRPRADAEVALNQADAHLINEDWAGGARVLRRYLALEPKNVRGREMLGVGAGGGRRSRRRAARCGAACPTICRRPRTIATTGGRSNAPRASRPRATGTGARSRRRAQPRRDARGRRTSGCASGPRPSWPAARSLRSDPQAWAWRVQAGAALPFGMRHSARRRSPGTTPRTTGTRTRSSGRTCSPKSGTVTGLGAQLVLARRSGASLLVGADARYATEVGRRRGRGRPAAPARQGFHFGAQAEGAANLWSVRAREHARRPQRAVERGADHRARRRDDDGRDRAPLSCFPRAASCCSTAARRCGSSRLQPREGTPEQPTAQPAAGLGRDRLQPVGQPDAGSCAPRRWTSGWCAAPI